MSNYPIDSNTLSTARNFLVQYLRDAEYEGSLEEGTGANDVLIKGLTLLHTVFKFDVDRAIAYLSLANAELLKDELGTEYDTVVDSILSNWFVSRKEGTASTGKLRLYFTRPVQFLQINKGTVIATIGSESLLASLSYTFSSTDFTSIVNSIENLTEFYVDISVEAAAATSTQPKVGDKVSILLSNVYLIRGDIPAELGDFKAGTPRESSESFITRTGQAITTRELITDRAISTVLMGEFNTLKSLYVARFGSAEQLRDIVSFEFIDVHVGNKADIYADADLEAITETLLVGGGSVTLPRNNVVSVVSVLDAEGAALPYSISGVTESAFGAFGTVVTLGIPDTLDGVPVTVRYLINPLLEGLDTFVASEDNRVCCYDPVVRGMFPVLISGDLTIRVRLALGVTLVDLEAQIKAAIKEFIESVVYPEVLSVSDLIQEIHNRVSGVSAVALPISLSYTLTDPKDFTQASGPLTDEFSAPTGVSDQITWNTLRYYTDPSLLSLTLVAVG
jgi:hypothetical protein